MLGIIDALLVCMLAGPLAGCGFGSDGVAAADPAVAGAPVETLAFSEAASGNSNGRGARPTTSPQSDGSGAPTSTSQPLVTAQTGGTQTVTSTAPVASLKYKAFFDSVVSANRAYLDAEAASGDALKYYDFMYVHDAHLNMFEATGDRAYLERSLRWMETQISLATVVDFNGNLNWRSGSAGGDTRFASVAVPYFLYDGQASTEFARLARIVLTDPELRSVYGARAQRVYDFVRRQMIEKWGTVRGDYIVNLTIAADPARGSGPISDKSMHWARILMDVTRIEPNPTYTAWHQAIMRGLVARLSALPGGPAGALIFDAGAPADTAHANRHVYALLDGYRNGTSVTAAHVKGVARLFSQVMWNRSTTDPRITNYIDGGNGAFEGRGAWANGAVWFGWTLLGAYDTEAQRAGEAILDSLIAGRTNPTLAYHTGVSGRLGLAGSLSRNARMIANGSVLP